jgi:hypothetical protein
MEAKLKAEELVEKFYWDYDRAKQCALIAVDEILECYPAQCPKESYEMEQHIYWQQVKTEINNL